MAKYAPDVPRLLSEGGKAVKRLPWIVKLLLCAAASAAYRPYRWSYGLFGLTLRILAISRFAAGAKQELYAPGKPLTRLYIAGGSAMGAARWKLVILGVIGERNVKIELKNVNGGG